MVWSIYGPLMGCINAWKQLFEVLGLKPCKCGMQFYIAWQGGCLFGFCFVLGFFVPYLSKKLFPSSLLSPKSLSELRSSVTWGEGRGAILEVALEWQSTGSLCHSPCWRSLRQGSNSLCYCSMYKEKSALLPIPSQAALHPFLW